MFCPSDGPGLGPNCWQGYQQTTKVAASQERVKSCLLITFDKTSGLIWTQTVSQSDFIPERHFLWEKIQFICVESMQSVSYDNEITLKSHFCHKNVIIGREF